MFFSSNHVSRYSVKPCVPSSQRSFAVCQPIHVISDFDEHTMQTLLVMSSFYIGVRAGGGVLNAMQCM